MIEENNVLPSSALLMDKVKELILIVDNINDGIDPESEWLKKDVLFFKSSLMKDTKNLIYYLNSNRDQC
ncbi:MAG: hypothetical protein COA79_15555 [Planctomycetota bacterium]|nr:MAG: hypothetical protein COA79_15555 [Planctomycetota bacterium]